MILETVSDNQDKPKRGRPRLLNPAQQSIVRLATDAKTARHQQNAHYQLKALGVLTDDARFLWLCDKDAMQAGQAHSYKPTILSELGRIVDADDLRAVALQLCEIKPKAKEAVAIIRRWRLGKPGDGDALRLANEIIGKINSYIERYPETTTEQIQTALLTAADAISKGYSQRD